MHFGNCNKNGNVIAYLDGKELPCTFKNQVEFEFKDGNKLEIAEDGEGMIQFNNLRFIECSDNNPNVPYSPDEPEDCACNELGSVDLTCDCDGKCSCKLNIVGDSCDQCEIEHYDFPNCKGIYSFSKFKQKFIFLVTVFLFFYETIFFCLQFACVIWRVHLIMIVIQCLENVYVKMKK